MSEESKELQELHKYQIQCAEQEGLIELLEKEIKRLTTALSHAQAHNRRLTIMLLEQPAAPKQSSAKTKKEDENKEPNDTTGTEEAPPPTDDSSGKTSDDTEELFDFEKFPFPLDDAAPSFKTYKEQVAYECQEFLKKYSFPDFYNEISKEIIGQEDGLKKMLAVIYNYIHTLASGERPEKCTAVILTAPSGNGKSALYKSLSSFFKTALPSLACSRKDAGRLVPSGYKGPTVNSILSDFVSFDKFHDEQRYGILWLDEFDKIRFNNDGGPQVQNQLLTYMDGMTEKYGDVAVDTQYIFWVASGSFNDVRKKKKQQADQTIGFVRSGKTYDAFDEITREDMLKVFSFEMIGRFRLIVSFNRLSEEAITCVIMKMLEDIYKDLHLDTMVSQEYINILIEDANTEFGCRKIYSTLYEICLKAYIDILQGGVYGIDEHPTVIIEGPDDYTILDEVIADQIRYDDNGKKYV